MRSDRIIDTARGQASDYADRARRMASDYADNARDYAGSARDSARGYAGQARRVAWDYAGDAEGRLRRGASRVKAGAEDYADEFGTRVADHPLPYVLAAALLGFVLGRVFRA